MVNILKKKYVKKMWRIHDVLFLDKVKSEAVQDGKEQIKLVFVGIDEEVELNPNGDSAEYFGNWIFTSEEAAQREVNEFNCM